MAQFAAGSQVSVQVVVPARNEELSIGRCLESLTAQQGIDLSITVVDDGSTDRTRVIAESFPTVRVITATEPPPGITGKCNALIQGVQGATAEWLLFTDADTFHARGSLAHFVEKAETVGLDLLSVSPEQETGTWSERAVLPLIFAALTRQYPPARVNDPHDPIAAANGQYLLVRRSVYEKLGGHRAVADKLLEDVELARLFKHSGRLIWFDDSSLIRARMYRDFRSLAEGWTKNLSLLFPHPLRMACYRALQFLAIIGLPVSLIVDWTRPNQVWVSSLVLIGIVLTLRLIEISRRGFIVGSKSLVFIGLPIFSWLLVRSWWRARSGRNITWKGRTYSIPVTRRASGSSVVKERGARI